MSNEAAIANFLKRPSEGGAYTDEKLIALLAHTEDGKLSYWSCCCFAGLPSAIHALRSYNREDMDQEFNAGHLWDPEDSKTDALWVVMSGVFGLLAATDEERRAKLIPFIYAEIFRRELLRAQPEISELATV